MSDTKIKTHTTYTYETADGREFDIAEEAEEWQKHLENINKVVMLNSNFEPTTYTDEAFFVHITSHEQLEAFEAIQAYNCFCAHIPKIGYWAYDDCSDEYINIEEKIKELSSYREKLDSVNKKA